MVALDEKLKDHWSYYSSVVETNLLKISNVNLMVVVEEMPGESHGF